ncbi:MAG: SBBP repeat-containing protein, partial [Armatimonadota bacterium]|nr:SBBP repeat-containing protein [Armatimonadota bacterium]
YAPGDKVIQLVNNYDKEVFNGDIGRIATIDTDEGLVKVELDGRLVEYDLVFHPGASPREVALEIAGADRLRLEPNGDLIIQARDEELRWRRPFVYQERNGKRMPIAGRFVLTDGNRVGVRLAPYDRTRPVVVDPVITYATRFGGSAEEFGDVVADATGIYLAGYTYSTDLPTTTDAYDRDGGGIGNTDVFVVKLDPTGSSVIFCTYLGGNDDDSPGGVRVDAAHAIYLGGLTYSTDFPVSSSPKPAAFQATLGGLGDAFVTKLNPTGTDLEYSTYLGGISHDGLHMLSSTTWRTAGAMTLDGGNRVCLTGVTSSPDFPVKNAFQNPDSQGDADVFVAVVDPARSGADSLLYATILGGTANDYGQAIAADPGGRVYITGDTESSDFPATAGVFQRTYGGGECDAFV